MGSGAFRYQLDLVQPQFAWVVQVNGRVRSRVTTPATIPEEELKATVLADTAVQRWLDNKSPKHIVIVPQKLVNIVV